MLNKYTNALATGLLVLSLNGVASGQEESQPEQPTKAEHTLTSTPDAETTLNEELAGKVRKLAELVMTKEKGEYQKLEDEFGKAVYVREFKVSESKGYELAVYDENGSLKAVMPESNIADSVIVVEYSLTENGERKGRAFLDYGLDGKLNVAETYVAPTNNLFPPEGLIDYEFTKEQLKEVKTFRKEVNGEVSDGVENQETFQSEFERVVDELIKLYETE